MTYNMVNLHTLPLHCEASMDFAFDIACSMLLKRLVGLKLFEDCCSLTIQLRQGVYIRDPSIHNLRMMINSKENMLHTPT
jgi:hypothetical protein